MYSFWKKSESNKNQDNARQKHPASFDTICNSSDTEYSGNMELERRISWWSGSSGVLLSIVVFETLVVTGLESGVVYFYVSLASQCMTTIESMGQVLSSLINRGLMISTQTYQIILCIDSLHRNSTIQLYTLIFFEIFTIVFAVLQIYQHTFPDSFYCDEFPHQNASPDFDYSAVASDKDTIDYYNYKTYPFEYAIVGILCLCFIGILICCVFSHRIRTWNHQFHYWVDKETKHTMIALFALSSLLKLDAFFCFTYVVQLIASLFINHSIPAWEIPVAFVLATLVLLFGWYSLENGTTMHCIAFTTAIFLSLGYFAFRIFTFVHALASGEDTFKLNYIYIIFTSIILVFLFLLTGAAGITYIRNTVHGAVILQNHCPSCKKNEFIPRISITAPILKQKAVKREEVSRNLALDKMGSSLQAEPKRSTDTCFFVDCISTSY